jgi:sulfur-oxidizing protein SoxZ
LSRIGKPRVRVPESAKRGEVIEIRTMVEHPMESGFRYNNIGKLVPRHIVESFTCTYNGREIFRARLHPAVSANPYFLFHTVATETGELVFTWTDDQGGVATISARIEVS